MITALTAQNTLGVSNIHAPPPSFVAEQLDAVLSDIHVDTVKTGMLFSPAIMELVADRIAGFNKRIVVVDPVMIAKGGAPLMKKDAVLMLQERLIPLAYLLTPNIPEAEVLTGLTISDEEGMEEACRALFRLGARNILIKGGISPMESPWIFSLTAAVSPASPRPASSRRIPTARDAPLLQPSPLFLPRENRCSQPYPGPRHTSPPP